MKVWPLAQRLAVCNEWTFEREESDVSYCLYTCSPIPQRELPASIIYARHSSKTDPVIIYNIHNTYKYSMQKHV